MAEPHDYFYCADHWCDGHTMAGQRCTEPLQQDDTDEPNTEDEETCP